MREVPADEAYSSVSNLGVIADPGAEPFIPLRSNVTGDDHTPLWRKIWGYYQLQRNEFLEHYHKRSNIETAR